MEITVRPTRVISWDPPEGIFAGELVNVSTGEVKTNEGIVDGPRFTLEIKVPSMRNKTVLVARTFAPTCPKLQRFLERWQGGEFMARHKDKKLDLKTLIGKPAEVIVEHIRNSGHKKP